MYVHIDDEEKMDVMMMVAWMVDEPFSPGLLVSVCVCVSEHV